VASSGFAETGPAGAALQDEVLRLAGAGGLRLVGPNCIGAVGVHIGLVASFSPLFSAGTTELVPGNLGFVSQSGALGYGAVSLAFERGLGLGWVVNTGNEADVTAVEVLTALAAEPSCRGLLGYLEGLPRGPALRELAATRTPVAVVKAGRSEAGRRAVASHTGALAAGEAVAGGVLRQFGVVRCADVDELLDVGDAFAAPRRPAGPRVGIVTTSGGSGIMAADAVEEYGLRLAELAATTEKALREVVPAFGSAANPVDVTATVMSDPGLFDQALDAVAGDGAVDLVVACFCVLTGEDVARIVASLARVADRTGKPVLVARTGADHLAPRASATLRAAGVPAYPTPRRAVRAAAGLWEASRPRAGTAWRDTPPVGPAPRGAASPADSTEPALKRLLAGAGLAVPRGRVVSDRDAAVAAVRDVGGRAVLKAVVPGLVHKTEAGAVLLDVPAGGAAAAYDGLAALAGGTAAGGAAVLVEELVRGGAEMLVGVAPSPMGQVLALASGGVLTEVIDDAVFRLLPITEADGLDMVAECRGAAALRGRRGGPVLDAGALVRVLVGVSDLVRDWPEGYQLDLNPVAVLPDRACILDVAYLPPGQE
jgi:acyl-CoA synthetase (NDP forming)